MRALASAAWIAAVLAVLPVDGGRASTQPARSCWPGYSYAGVQTRARAFGVSATLTMNARPAVASGHVAAWIGVGGAGLGPGGSDEWLQAGIARDAGGSDVLYYEFKRPADATATDVQLGPVAPRRTHALAILESTTQRDAWRVLIDGVRVGSPIVLPDGHGMFEPIATVESWDGGVAASCNRYSFTFADLAVESRYGGGWQPFDLARVLRDPAYLLTLRASGFTASSR